MKAINRLEKYINYKGLNKRQFEIDNELSNGYIGTQLRRDSDLGESILVKILNNCLDLSPEWLLTGRGEMIVKENIRNARPDPASQNKTYLEEVQEKLIKSQEREIAELKNQLRSCNCSHKPVEEHK